MSQLVDTLKAEHANIVKMLTRVGELGVNTDEGRKTLHSAKTGLLSHLGREDDHLYPALVEAAKHDPVIQDALDVFLEDMKGVSAAALAFFEKVENGGGGDALADDFSHLVEVLAQRIRKEEAVIYEMYDQLEAWKT